MVLLIIAWITVILLLVRLIVVAVNFMTWPLLPKGRPRRGPLVSILIPARNEEENIEALLEDLEKQEYGNIEVLIFDDESTDRTYEIARSFAAGSSVNAEVLRSEGLPAGWMGKNHACHRLAEEASGDYLLFLDADVSVKPSLIPDSLDFLVRNKLDLLSLFPVQIMKSFGEKLTVPMMNWFLLTLLPMILIRKSKRPSFAAANGQFMLFRSGVYRRYRFHEMLRNQPVEDIHIQREMKKLDRRAATLLSGGQISCRMYTSAREGVIGFSRNVAEFFGGSHTLLLLYLLFTTLGPFILWDQWGWEFLAGYLLIVLLKKAMVSVLSRQSVIMNMLLAFPQQVSAWMMGLRSLSSRWKRELKWKERTLRI